VMNRDQIAAQLAPATVAAHDEHDDE